MDTPTFAQSLQDLDRLASIEREVREIHDRVCGKGMYLAESEPPLGEVGYGIRDVLYSQIGEYVHEVRQAGMKVLKLPPVLKEQP